jgi:hypothetical protein
MIHSSVPLQVVDEIESFRTEETMPLFGVLVNCRNVVSYMVRASKVSGAEWTEILLPRSFLLARIHVVVTGVAGRLAAVQGG